MRADEHNNFVQLLNTLPTKNWRGCIIHHSLTEDGDALDIEGIKKFHKSYRIDGKSVSRDEFDRRKAMGEGKRFLEPWKDIGYHLVLEQVNKQLLWELGRPLDQPGAHTFGFNDSHLGICLVGDYDLKNPYDTPRWELLLEMVRTLMQLHEFTVNDVLGHRETFERRGVPVEKSCPGWKFDLKKFRQDLTVAPPPAKKFDDDDYAHT